MKKNVLAAAALGSLAVLGLAACSPASESEASPSASATAEDTSVADAAALESIEWTETDGVPELTFDAPLSVGNVATRVIEEGDGDIIEDGQNVTLDYVVYAGTDASRVYATYDSATPEVVSMIEGQVVQDLYDSLVGQPVGTDFIYAYPDTSATDGTAAIMAVTATEAVTPLEKAEGTAVEPAEGLPTVTLDETGAPSIDWSTADKKPTELVSQTLIEGDGEKVAEGDQVTVHYTGWVWDGDEPFDSSWARGASNLFTLSTDSLIEGWVQGMAGQTVGSQVLIVIPPELAYGDQESETIPADSTLVFVVDILAVG